MLLASRRRKRAQADWHLQSRPVLHKLQGSGLLDIGRTRNNNKKIITTQEDKKYRQIRNDKSQLTLITARLRSCCGVAGPCCEARRSRVECHVRPAPSGLPPLRRPQGSRRGESEDDHDHHPAPELLDPRSARPRPPEQAQPQAKTCVLLLSRQ